MCETVDLAISGPREKGAVGDFIECLQGVLSWCVLSIFIPATGYWRLGIVMPPAVALVTATMRISFPPLPAIIVAHKAFIMGTPLVILGAPLVWRGDSTAGVD